MQNLTSNIFAGSEGDEDDDDIFVRKYLAAQLDLDPGHFDCECIWKEKFIFHPRLKAGSTSRGSTMSTGRKSSLYLIYSNIHSSR